jgi:hypothetical protein
VVACRKCSTIASAGRTDAISCVVRLPVLNEYCRDASRAVSAAVSILVSLSLASGSARWLNSSVSLLSSVLPYSVRL